MDKDIYYWMDVDICWTKKDFLRKFRPMPNEKDQAKNSHKMGGVKFFGYC